MKLLFYIFALVVLCPVAWLWRGFVTIKLWAWFVIPTFGVAPLSLSTAIGLSLLVSFTTYVYRKEPKSDVGDTEHIAMSIIIAFFSPALALFVGYFALHFLPR